MTEKIKKSKLFNFFLKSLLVFFIFLIFLILFIGTPWGQDIIVQRAVTFLSEKTGTHIAVERLFITLTGDVKLEGLYVQDLSGDTLVFSGFFNANIPFLPIVQKKGIVLKALKWDGLRANILREDSIQGYNFQFLINAFVSDTIEVTENSEPMNWTMRKLDLSNFDLTFKDKVMGMDGQFNLGELQVDL